MREGSDEMARLQDLSLKVRISKFMVTGRGFCHLTLVRANFHYSYTDEEIEAAVSELVAEGLLARTVGKRGSVILQQMYTPKEEANG